MPPFMNDFFKRGYQFDGATGQRSGENLEDLATRLVPADASELVDQSTIETYADATIVDDASNPVNRLRVKAGGIGTSQLANGGVTAEKLAKGAWLGPQVSLVAGSMATVGSWSAAPSAVANALDGSDITHWGDAVLGSGNMVMSYWDLGAVYWGHLLLLAEAKSSVEGQFLRAVPTCTYKDVPTVNDAYLMAFNKPAIANVYTTFLKHSAIVPFIGRYVGIALYQQAGADGTFRAYRFDVYGTTLT